MAALQNYAIYTPSTATLRGMVGDPQARDPLGLSGGRLAEAFSEFKKAHLDPDEELLDDVLELVDWVKNVDTTTTAGSLLSPSVARTRNVLRFTDRFMKEGRNTLTAYDASEGALYLLFSAILCLSSQAPKVFSIDNIDQALNPRLAAALIRKICSWVRKAGSDRQLIFTVHNPAALDGLDLTDDEIRLFAVDRNSDGQTVVKRIEMTPNSPLCRRIIRSLVSGSWGISEPCRMSELAIGIVAEGPTDFVIIEAALRACSQDLLSHAAATGGDASGDAGGLGRRLQMVSFRRGRGFGSPELDPTLSRFDLLIIHIDADVAEDSYSDILSKRRRTFCPSLRQALPAAWSYGRGPQGRCFVLAWCRGIGD